MDENLKNRSSLAALLVFLLVFVLNLIPRYIGLLKKKGSLSPEEIKLRAEIKQLLKEANSLSGPSTFAQAAKLKRMAVAKEKELQKSQEMQNTKMYSHDTFLKAVMVLKLLQPLGKQLSWSAGDPVNGYSVVGIMPWLVLSGQVSNLVCQKFVK